MAHENDPFAEEEVTYTGPIADTQSDEDNYDNAEDNADSDPYALDDGDVDDFDFDDDEPEDWAPPVVPNTESSRKPTVTSSNNLSQRPAVNTSGTLNIDASSFSAPAPQPTAQENLTPAPQPRHRAATPDVGMPTNRSLKDRVMGWFKGSKQEPANDEIRTLHRNLSGTINIAFLNRKGGVGKTLCTTLTGMTLAEHRNDHVIAVDASPEGGELCDRVEREQYGSVRSLINQLDSVKRYSHVRTHTSQDYTGLEVLGSDPDAVGEPELTADEYRAMIDTLRDYYPFILTDCAQGVTTPVMEAVLEEADVLVLVSEGADGMRSATWVASQLSDPHGPYGDKYAHLVDDMIVVVTQRSARSNMDMGKIADHFRSIVRRVVELPYDQALEGGRPFTLEEVEQSTRQAGLDIATAITTSAAFQAGGRA